MSSPLEQLLQLTNGQPIDAAALEQLRKAMADRHEAWLREHMATQGQRAQDIGDSFQPPRPRVGPFPPATLLDLLKGR